MGCTGLGEIAIAVAAGVPREQLVAHGVNNSTADLEAAFEHAGVLVVDNLNELQRMVEISRLRRLRGALSALPVRGPERPLKEPIRFAGPYCESGDVLIEALPFPEVREGDLVAVSVRGAYQLSISSNYNGNRRPAVIWLDDGQTQISR